MHATVMKYDMPVKPAEQVTVTATAPRDCRVYKLQVPPNIAAHFDLVELSFGGSAIIDARGHGGGAVPLAHYHDVGLGLFVPAGMVVSMVLMNASDAPQVFSAELLGEWISDGVPRENDADRG